MDETFHHHYVTMLNAGCAMAWKVISLGVEWRWGSAKYNGLTFDGLDLDEDSFGEEDNPSMGGCDGSDVGAEAQAEDLVDANLSELPILIGGFARGNGRPAGMRAVFFAVGTASRPIRDCTGRIFRYLCA